MYYFLLQKIYYFSIDNHSSPAKKEKKENLPIKKLIMQLKLKIYRGLKLNLYFAVKCRILILMTKFICSLLMTFLIICRVFVKIYNGIHKICQTIFLLFFINNSSLNMILKKKKKKERHLLNHSSVEKRIYVKRDILLYIYDN